VPLARSTRPTSVRRGPGFSGAAKVPDPLAGQALDFDVKILSIE
jgi:hypothetical protein